MQNRIIWGSVRYVSSYEIKFDVGISFEIPVAHRFNVTSYMNFMFTTFCKLIQLRYSFNHVYQLHEVYLNGERPDSRDIQIALRMPRSHKDTKFHQGCTPAQYLRPSGISLGALPDPSRPRALSYSGCLRQRLRQPKAGDASGYAKAI